MKYDDIINYNYKGSKRGHMSLYDRSAQFSSFQALEGYMDDVKETERITQDKIYLDEYEEEALNNKILLCFNNRVESTITYFIKDTRKNGGSYNKVKGIIKKIDSINEILELESKTKISIKDIISVEY